LITWPRTVLGIAVDAAGPLAEELGVRELEPNWAWTGIDRSGTRQIARMPTQIRKGSGWP